MTDAEFWKLISLLDWDQTGDDEAVVEPLVEELARREVSDICGFQDLLTKKLFALDTEAHARALGKHAYVGPDKHFSVDWFLYARCCVVANGLAFYSRVLADPSQWPREMDFESLLYVAGSAYELKTGKEFEHDSPLSYETFSNRAGWA